MKYAPALSLAALLLAGADFLSTAAAADFYVAPKGDDANASTKDKPFATLEAARDAARSTGAGPHRIVLTPGDYFLAKTLELDARDNGLAIEAEPAGKATLHGGKVVTGWRRDGDKFWYADLPGVKEGTWDFRTLVVNGRMPERARMPEAGTLFHQTAFDVPFIGGIGFVREPTREELTVMRYDPKDVPETLDANNAEVTVLSMWTESLVAVARNDVQQHALVFRTPCNFPIGCFGKKGYIIWNTREGMTRPGKWYLDRTNGRLVYWPLEGEDMARITVVAPTTENIIRIAGDPKKKAERITLRGLAIQGPTTPALLPPGARAYDLDGALKMTNAHQCVLERLDVSSVGGTGVAATQVSDSRIAGCHIHHTGGGGAKIEGGEGVVVEHNHIHDVGLSYFGSAAIYIRRSNHLRIGRNEIHEAPYCGILVHSAPESVVQENLIYRVMRTLHDGAAIYCITDHIVLRGNVARDIIDNGKGNGAFGYYFDQSSHDCTVERNVAIGVPKPLQLYITHDNSIRDNVFINEGDIRLQFGWSSRIQFQRNTLITPGKVTVDWPHSVAAGWKDNCIFSNASDKGATPQAFTIDSAAPEARTPNRKGPLVISRAAKPPTLDGERATLASGAWPGNYEMLERLPSRQLASGGTVFVKFCWDDECLYISAMINMIDKNRMARGHVWETDDGVEISLHGVDAGKPATFVIRGYADGTAQSVTDAGASAEAADRLGKDVRYMSKPSSFGWIGEWAIPFNAIGLKPKPDLQMAFNVCAFVNEFDNWHCWEGTRGESWQVDNAGMLMLK